MPRTTAVQAPTSGVTRSLQYLKCRDAPHTCNLPSQPSFNLIPAEVNCFLWPQSKSLPQHFCHALVPDFLLQSSLALHSELPLLYTNHSATFMIPGLESIAHRSGLELLSLRSCGFSCLTTRATLRLCFPPREQTSRSSIKCKPLHPRLDFQIPWATSTAHNKSLSPNRGSVFL